MVGALSFEVEGSPETRGDQSAQDRTVNRTDPRIARKRAGARRAANEFVVGEAKSAADANAQNES